MSAPRKRRTRRPLSIAYDPIADTVTINGMTYAGDLFRTLAFPEPGHVYRATEESVKGQRVIQIQELTPTEHLTAADLIPCN